MSGPVPQDASSPELDLLGPLAGERVVRTNTLATVTRNWVLLKNPEAHKRVYLAVPTITDVRRVRTVFPGLLVIAAALFVIAAAAASSKQGGNAGLPFGILSVIFVVFFFGSRRGAVCFQVGDEEFCTINGTLGEAKALADTVQDLLDKARSSAEDD
jgi:hypothetical protein